MNLSAEQEDLTFTSGQELSAKQMKTGFRCMIVASIFAVIAGQIFAGNILTLLAWSMGAKEGYIGLLRMLVFWGALAQLAIVPLAQRSKKRELIIGIFIIALLLCLPILAVHWVKGNYGLNIALAMLAACVVGRSLTIQLATPSWMGLLREVTAPNKRGRLLGWLRTSWQSSAVLVLILTGLYLGKEPPEAKLQIVLYAGVLAQAIRAVVLLPVSNPPIRTHKTKTNHAAMLLSPLRDANYRGFWLYATSYGVAMGFSEVFKVVYLLRLGFSERFTLIASSLVSLGSMATLIYWGKLADKYGNRGLFGVCLIAVIVINLLWLLVQPTTAGMVLSLVLFGAGGAFNSGNGIAQTRFMFGSLKPELEAGYLAMTAVGVSVGVGIGSLIGGQFLHIGQTYLGFTVMTNYRVLFACGAALFVVPLVLRRKFKVSGEASTRHILTAITQPLRVVFGSILAWPIDNDNNDTGPDRTT